jgi:iron complex outermembrane receptor protein
MMRQRLLTTLAVISLSAANHAAAGQAPAQPPAAFEARIVSARTKEPIASAEVTILGRPGTTYSDAEGRVTWRPAPQPPFEVLVILPGGHYMKPKLIETAAASEPLTIEVEPLLEETVTVTAAAAPAIEATPASATTMLTAHDLQVREPVNLAQALENVAGVASTSEGQAAVPTIRGLAGGRTLILIDGARVTTERRAGASATFLDPFVLESVEVSRGPGSVAYGSDAFGGVIFARTRRVEPGAPLRFRVAGALGAGTPEQRVAAEMSRGLRRGGMLFQIHYRSFDDYRSPSGTIFNSGSEDQGFLARVEHALGPGTFAMAWQSDFGRDIERPRNNSRIVRFFYPEENSHRLTMSYDLRSRGGFDRITTNAFLGRYHVITDQDRFATSTGPREVERADVAARDFQFRTTAGRNVGTTHIEIGADVNGRYGLRALDTRLVFADDGALAEDTEIVSVDDARRINVGGFGSIDVPIGTRLLLAGGIRGDHIGTRNQGGFFGDRTTSHAAASGFGSITITLPRNVSVTAQLARGFRDPVLSDRYFRGPTGRGFITGNPDLEPERSVQLDSAVRYSIGRQRFAFYAYEYRLTDLIERFETDTDSFFFRNRGRARIRGVELEAQLDLGHGVGADITGQVTRGSDPADGTALDDIPPRSLALQLRKTIGGRGFVQVRGAAFARDDRPGPTERTIPGYFVLDASGGWTIQSGLELRLLARNVLDQEYLVSPDGRSVPAPGISGLLTLMARF